MECQARYIGVVFSSLDLRQSPQLQSQNVALTFYTYSRARAGRGLRKRSHDCSRARIEKAEVECQARYIGVVFSSLDLRQSPQLQSQNVALTYSRARAGRGLRKRSHDCSRARIEKAAGVAFESENFHSTPSRSQGTNFSNTQRINYQPRHSNGSLCTKRQAWRANKKRVSKQ